MITLILAVAAAPVQLNATVIERPVAVQSGAAAASAAARKQQMIADARALLDEAERARIAFRPAAASGQLSKADLDASIAQTKDSLADMSQMDQMQLQMAMDRLSKAMSTLSNLLKKVSDSQGTITNNIK